MRKKTLVNNKATSNILLYLLIFLTSSSFLNHPSCALIHPDMLIPSLICLVDCSVPGLDNTALALPKPHFFFIGYSFHLISSSTILPSVLTCVLAKCLRIINQIFMLETLLIKESKMLINLMIINGAVQG